MRKYYYQGQATMAGFYCLILLLLSNGIAASDLARERRIASEIEDAILVGEAVRLSAAGVSFFAIFTPADTDSPRGAVILLHGKGANPDWTDVIQPLRSELPERGWATLSLQMPIAAATAPATQYLALIPEAAPRIDAAVDFLMQRRITNLVLVGHSLGARMGLAYLAQRTGGEVRAFVAVGISADPSQTGSDTLSALRQITIPVLDIFGSRDLDAVRRTARERVTAARTAGNSHYRQTEIPGANHFFHGLEDSLIAEVNAWISRATAQAAAAD